MMAAANDAVPGSSDQEETLRRIEGYLNAYPGLRSRVSRLLLLALHSSGHVRIEDVYRQAQRAEEWNLPSDPNRPSSRLWGAEEREVLALLAIKLAAEHLSPTEVDEIVWSAHRRDEAQSLEALARAPDIPLELLADKVNQFAALQADDEPPLGTPDEAEGTRVALIRRFISDRLDYIAVAKRFLRVRDMGPILDRALTTERGQGRVGGKAAGMILAWAIQQAAEDGEEAHLPDTAYVLTDVHEEFTSINGLGHLEHHKYKPIQEVRDEFTAIREIFRNGEFPERVVDHMRAELVRWGEVPLIVRSSSLLEDNYGSAFSGIYQSLFVRNRGPLESRLDELLGAIAEIYAAVFSADAVQYRRRHNLLDYDELMGVMIQAVVGSQYGRYFLPTFAGVAFSRNDYRWSSRINREDGLMRLVLGLGTHAVDRVGDFPRMVALAHPTLRPETTPDAIQETSQKKVDVIDSDGMGFERVPVGPVLEAMRDTGIGDLVSVRHPDGTLAQPVGTRVTAPVSDLCVTFDGLLGRKTFPKRIQAVLRRLEAAFGCPVDLEFAVDQDKLYLLQCRPLGTIDSTQRVRVPAGIPRPDRIFSARCDLNSGYLRGIEYVVLIDPRDYKKIETVDLRRELAHCVGRINDALADRVFMLMGPGRWGSQDIQLGVQVTYADICNAKVLVEIAREHDGYTPEPSFGTHFFQDLVENRILYLPLYPDDLRVEYREEFFEQGPNALEVISPRDAHLSDLVRVIAVNEVRPGRRLDLALDGDSQFGLCYFA